MLRKKQEQLWKEVSLEDFRSFFRGLAAMVNESKKLENEGREKVSQGYKFNSHSTKK